MDHFRLEKYSHQFYIDWDKPRKFCQNLIEIHQFEKCLFYSGIHFWVMNSIETEEVKILTLWLDFYKKKVLQINKSFLISDLNRIH